MTSKLDLGLEKISIEYREECWQQANLNPTTFIDLISNDEQGGVSSEAEAYRLLRAEQIGNHCLIEHGEDLENLAKTLLDDILENFQHNLHPISTNSDQDQQLTEIIDYYFPSKEKLEIFLSFIDNKALPPPKKAPTAPTNSQIPSKAIPTPPQTSPAPLKPKLSPNIKPKLKMPPKERSKIDIYIHLTDTQKTKYDQISPFIKEIINNIDSSN